MNFRCISVKFHNFEVAIKQVRMVKSDSFDTDHIVAKDEPLWGEFRVTGSHKVFRKFFMSWYSDLCRYALYWLPDMQDAEEVVLDFFMHLWLHRSTVNISSSFKGYALMSVRNRCISRLRCSRVTVSIEDLDPLSCLYEQDGMSVEDASRIVWEAVSTLPAKSREIFRKSRNEGMTNADIAASMGISVKTVEGHITRSLKAIRVALKKYFIFIFLSF